MKDKTPSQDWLDTFKKNPEEIIAWAEREIEEYKNLIKIIRDQHEA